MTSQAHEKIIIDGDELTMAFCPALPEGSGDIVPISPDEAERINKDKNFPRIIFSSACWRRYIATWEIKGGKLYLNDIKGKYKKISNSPILASWVTGVLRIPIGDIVVGVNMGFGTVFEKELHIKIEEGLVTKRVEVDNANKHYDKNKLAEANFPGNENSFDGDDI